jgi:hypothetical protein
LLSLVDVGQESGEDSDAVESISFRGKIGVWKGRMILQYDQARCYRQNKGLEVLERGISSSADIGMREEAEDVFDRLGQFPELLPDQRESGPTMRRLTFVQYGSLAAMFRSSESLKMPCLKISFDSDAPMVQREHGKKQARQAEE